MQLAKETEPIVVTPTLHRRSRSERPVVTGGAGFIGSHLVERLVAEGSEVLVIDDLSSGSPTNLPREARLERRDIAADDLDGLLRRWRPTCVFHLAAQSSVPRSTSDPLGDLAVNVVGSHHVAAAALASGAERLVFVSSGGAIYGETRRPARETARPAPSSYYGIHKLAAEGHVALAGVSHAIARPANVFGPRQRAGLEGAVVAAFVEQAVSGGPLRIHGDGSQTRDFVHVHDVTEALVLLARPGTGDGIWNLASGRRTSIAELADLVEREVGRALGRSHGPRRTGDVTESVLSAARLRAIGWRATVSLDAGLRELLGASAPASR